MNIIETYVYYTKSYLVYYRMQQQSNNSSSGLSLLSKENSFLTESSSNREFGFVTTDSLVNPSSHKNSSTPRAAETTEAQQQQQHQPHSLRHFIDDWPKSQPNRQAGLSWPEMDIQSDRTQLSISIPMDSSASVDFVPSSSSPEKTSDHLSPLRLSRELDRVPMSLGVGAGREGQLGNRQASWIPRAWENSLGGPLGEVLHHTNNNTSSSNNNGSKLVDKCKNSSSSSSSVLNLMTDGWDSSPPMGSSPTGVLQKTAFGSLSNSSAGSSPRAEHNKSLD